MSVTTISARRTGRTNRTPPTTASWSMEYLSVRTDNLNQPTPTLPPPGQRLSIFSFGGASRLSSRVELAFFRERSRGINAERFLFSRAFSDKSLRGDPSARSLRLAPRSLGRDDKQRGARKSTVSLRGRTGAAAAPKRGSVFSAPSEA